MEEVKLTAERAAFEMRRSAEAIRLETGGARDHFMEEVARGNERIAELIESQEKAIETAREALEHAERSLRIGREKRFAGDACRAALALLDSLRRERDAAMRMRKEAEEARTLAEVELDELRADKEAK